MHAGFVGTGNMGRPMAANMLRAVSPRSTRRLAARVAGRGVRLIASQAGQRDLGTLDSSGLLRPLAP